MIFLPARFQRYLAFLSKAFPWMLVFLAFLGIIAAPWGLECSFIERLTHVRFYWIGGLTVLLLWWICKKAWLPALLVLGLLVAAMPAVWRYYRPVAPLTTSGAALPTFRVATWNVHSSNPERERGVAWLTSLEVDVLLLTEVNPGWVKTLKKAASRWPHQICEPRGGAAGIWLLSRWPLVEMEAAGIAPEETRPWIGCRVQSPQGKVAIMGMHPRTPRGGHRFVERNLQLERAAEFSAAAALRGEPVVLMGDLNCTPFSPWFDRLLTRGLLRDSAVGLSLKPTWSSGPWWLPLDHILLGGKWEVRERRVYEDRLGSDHFPVMATLGFPEIPGRTREKYSTNL